MADLQPAPQRAPFELVAVATSMGGLEALTTLLSGLPEQFDVPIVVAHHRSPVADDEQEVRLFARRARLPVRIAAPGRPVLVPGVTLIPSGYLATFTPRLRYRLTATTPAAERRRCGDALLCSAAEHFGPRVIAVVLSGSLDDGAAGVRALKRRGARVLIQDPRTARAAGMPTNAIATGCVDFILPVERMAAALTTLAIAPGGAEFLTVHPPSWARLHA